MKHRPTAARNLAWFLPSLVLALAVTAVTAQDLDQVMQAGADRIQVAQASQERIDQVVDQTDGLESEYKQILKQLDGLRVYNDYMQRQIENQELELAALRANLDQVGVVERQIMPLMIRMLDGLEKFIGLDVPFLMDERLTRVERLRVLMERADITLAEKFRRLTEAFQIENDFGRTIEIYKDALDIEGATLEVNVLRLGRIGLYYQTNDASATGQWDRTAGAWTPLTGGRERAEIRRGIRIARKLVAPDLLLLPVPAPAAEVTP
ncbi:MAG: DUF3450 domain-containing protein [bacterium]|nr:DUF3450 domain-containing protein [bacterium]